MTSVGRVLSIEDGFAVVDLDGRRRSAVALAVPDLRVGELVLVGVGAVLGRVDAADRAALDSLIDPLTPDHPPARRT